MFVLVCFARPLISSRNPLCRVYQRESAKNGGKAPPEARLLMGMAGAIVTPIGLFIFTFTTYASVPWIIPILGTIFFGMGIVWVFTSVFTYLVE
jgi:hypothetical protein